MSPSSSKAKPIGQEDTVAYRVICPKAVWENFKEVTPKSMTMNSAMLELIYSKLGIDNPRKCIDNLTKKKNR